MNGSSPHTLDYALIEARAGELGWDTGDFIRKIGIHPQDLHRVLQPDQVSLTWLFRIAEALDLHPGELITEPMPDVGQSAQDAAMVETMLAPRRSPSWVSRETLSAVLGWTPQRVQDALNTLQDQLDGTAVTLIRGNAGWALASRSPSPSISVALSAMRQRIMPLSLEDAAHLTYQLGAAVKRSRHNGPGAPHICEALDAREQQTPTDSLEPQNRSVWTAPSPHPDILFALLLTDRPDPDEQPADDAHE